MDMVSPSPLVGKSNLGEIRYRYQEERTALIFPGWRLPSVILSHDVFCLNSKIGAHAMGV